MCQPLQLVGQEGLRPHCLMGRPLFLSIARMIRSILINSDWTQVLSLSPPRRGHAVTQVAGAPAATQVPAAAPIRPLPTNSRLMDLCPKTLQHSRLPVDGINLIQSRHAWFITVQSGASTLPPITVWEGGEGLRKQGAVGFAGLVLLQRLSKA